MSIAVQTAVGDIGGKATTEQSFSFTSLINAGGYQYGANGDGIFQLNTGETDDGVSYERTFTLATTDIGVKNPKRGRFVYIGYDASTAFTLSVNIDGQAWRDYTVTPLKTGLQRILAPIGRDGQGRYFTFKITSTSRFTIDSLELMFVTRSTGIKGY